MSLKPAAIDKPNIFLHSPYTVTITSRSTKTFNSDGIALLRNTDTVTCSQHGAQTIIGTASIARDLDSKIFAREGDITSCGAVISVGSGDATILLS